jgi:hypothetical protein
VFVSLAGPVSPLFANQSGSLTASFSVPVETDTFVSLSFSDVSNFASPPATTLIVRKDTLAGTLGLTAGAALTDQTVTVLGTHGSENQTATVQFSSTPPPCVPTQVVISQVYGGGGNSGSTYKNDFVELYNRGETDVTFSNWSVQYASASGSSWQVTIISGTIAKGGYFLVQEAAGSGGTTNLPTPDGTGSIAMSSSDGKVALAKSTTALTTACPAAGTFADFVGYGNGYSTGCATVTKIPTLTNTLAGLRNNAGCALDFATGAASPRNTAQTPTAVCSACSD